MDPGSSFLTRCDWLLPLHRLSRTTPPSILLCVVNFRGPSAAKATRAGPQDFDFAGGGRLFGRWPGSFHLLCPPLRFSLLSQTIDITACFQKVTAPSTCLGGLLFFKTCLSTSLRLPMPASSSKATTSTSARHAMEKAPLLLRPSLANTCPPANPTSLIIAMILKTVPFSETSMLAEQLPRPFRRPSDPTAATRSLSTTCKR